MWTSTKCPPKHDGGPPPNTSGTSEHLNGGWGRGLDRRKRNIGKNKRDMREFVHLDSVVHRHSWWKRSVAYPVEKIDDYVKHIFSKKINQKANHIRNLQNKKITIEGIKNTERLETAGMDAKFLMVCSCWFQKCGIGDHVKEDKERKIQGMCAQKTILRQVSTAVALSSNRMPVCFEVLSEVVLEGGHITIGISTFVNVIVIISRKIRPGSAVAAPGSPVRSVTIDRTASSATSVSIAEE